MASKRCAACGGSRARTETTFMVGRPGCHGEFGICSACWEDGPNDEAWNERITQKIIEARATKKRESAEKREL